MTQVDFLGTEHDLLLSYLIGQIISRHFKMAAETTEITSEITIPRLEATVPSSMIVEAVKSSFGIFGIDKPTTDQEAAVKAFLEGQDVMVVLPTGEGKSLCFAALPLAFDCLKRFIGARDNLPLGGQSIIVVVSPLKALMKNQIDRFSVYLKCAYVGEEDDEIKQKIVQGIYQIVYMSPESLLCVLIWREMFRSLTYQEALVGLIVDEAHCIKYW